MARFFIPNVTTAVRTAGTAVTGELVFDTDLNQYFQGTSSAGPNNWQQLEAESIASVVQYSASTTYSANEIVRDATGLLYVSLVASNLGNALTDTNSWLEVGGSGTVVTHGGNVNNPVTNIAGGIYDGLTDTVTIQDPPTLAGVVERQLDAFPKEAEYDYSVASSPTLTPFLGSSEDFLNSLGLSIVFNPIGNTPPTITEDTTYYLYNTTPSPLTNQVAEPDVILTFPRFGYTSNLSGNRRSYIFNIDKGRDIVDAFVGIAPDIDLTQTAVDVGGVTYNGNNLFGTFYTRIASDTGTEVLTYDRADGTIDWRVPTGGPTSGLTAVTSDTTLSGSGTSGSPLGVANDAINIDRLDFAAGATTTNDATTRLVALDSTPNSGEFATVLGSSLDGVNVQDSGGTLTNRTTRLNLTGSGVSLSQNGNTTTATITGGTGTDTFQHFDISQVVSWFEAQAAREFSGATVAFSDPDTTITFGNNADASQFFNDLNPSQSNGTFTSTVTLPVFQGSTPLVIVRPGATVSVSGSVVTLTNVSSVASSGNDPLRIQPFEIEEGRVGFFLEFPVTSFSGNPNATITLTVSNSDTSLARFNQLGIADPDSTRIILAHDNDEAHAFYRIASFTPGMAGTTDAVMTLTPMTSYANDGSLGVAGGTPAFNFTLPTSGNIDFFSVGAIQPRDNTFISLNDTPTTFNGNAGQFLRVNSTGTGLEFIAQEEDPIATITAIAAPNNTASWTPLSIYDETLFNGITGLTPTQTVNFAGATPFEAGSGQLIRTSGSGVVPREMSSFLAQAINASGITIVQDDYYVLTFPNASTSGFNNQIAIFRASQNTSLPTATGDLAQTFLNDELGTAVATADGLGPTPIPFTIRRYARADMEAQLINFNSNALDLGILSGSQTIRLSTESTFAFMDSTPTINARILGGSRIFARIAAANGMATDDTYLEILNASATEIVLNKGAKFTVDSTTSRTQDSTDTRRVEFNVTSIDDPVYRALYEHRVVQIADPAIIDLNGAPSLATGITAAEVRTLLEVSDGGVTIAASLPSTTGTIGELISTTGATSVVGDQFERVTWSIPRSSVVTSLGTATSITVALYAELPTNDGMGGIVDVTGGSDTVTLTTGGSVSQFVAGLPAAIMRQSQWASLFTGANPLYTLSADDDGTNVNLRVTATVAGDLTPNARTNDAGSGQAGFIMAGGGGLVNSGTAADDLTIDTVGADPQIFPRGVYTRRTNVGNPTDWILVDSQDLITFTTGEDMGATDSHTFTGVTTSFGGQSGTAPDVATFTFASQADAFAFFALTGGEANNGVSTRSLTVVYGATTLVFPVGTQLGPGGGNDLEVLNRSVITGGLAVQTTPTDMVIQATADIPVHATGNRFNLVGGTGMDVDLDPATDTITFNATASGTTLSGLTDTNITGVADNQILQYSTGTSRWLNRTPTMVVNQTPLADHNNVAATTPSSGNVLTWNGTMWAPAAPSGPPGSGTTVGVWQAENGTAITVAANNTPQALSWTTGAPFLFGTNFVTGGNTLPAGTYKFTLTSRCDQVTNAQTAGRGYWSTALTVGTTVYESGVDYIRYRQPHQGSNSIVTVYVTTTGAATTFSATSTLNVEAAGSSANSTIPIGGTRLIIERLS